MNRDYKKIFETAGWIQFDDNTMAWWIENLLKPMSHEDPVRLLKAIDLIENSTEWYFDRVAKDKFLRFDKASDMKARLYVKSVKAIEQYVKLFKRSAA